MTALPVRFANRATCCFDCCKKNEALLAQALAIAWKALDKYREVSCANDSDAAYAMCRIEKLGAQG